MTDKPKLTVIESINKDKDSDGMPKHAGEHLKKNLDNVDWSQYEEADYLLTVYTGDSVLVLTNLPSISSINLHLDTSKMNLLMGGVTEGGNKL